MFWLQCNKSKANFPQRDDKLNAWRMTSVEVSKSLRDSYHYPPAFLYPRTDSDVQHTIRSVRGLWADPEHYPTVPPRGERN